VANSTGVQGVFSFQLEWTPDSPRQTAGPGGALPDVPTAPSLFTVLQQDLGLRLEPQKAQIEVLTIDKAEKPSEN